MTIQWQDDAVRMALADQVKKAVDDRDALLAQRAELICEVETMRARLGAWRECARRGVRLVEHITVTQSTDGQWKDIAALYDFYDELHDAEADEFPALDEPHGVEVPIAVQARAKAAR